MDACSCYCTLSVLHQSCRIFDLLSAVLWANIPQVATLRLPFSQSAPLLYPMDIPYRRPKDGFTTVELVRNLKALEAGGRVSHNPHRIDIREIAEITMIEHNRKAHGEVYYDVDNCIHKSVRLTRGFYRRFDAFLGAFFWWDMPLSGLYPPWVADGEMEVVPSVVETRMFLVFCGVHCGEEGRKVAKVKEICVPVQGEEMIKAGIFKDWKEIECYRMVLGILEQGVVQGLPS